MTFGLRLCAVAFLIANVFSLPAAAALTAEQLASVGVTPSPGATLPLDAPLKDLDGRPTTLRRVIADTPAVIVFADYRCTQLCSPILAVTGQALAKSGLDPGRDYRLIVVGFNPAATAADARQMVGGQIGFDTPVGRATFPLMGSEPFRATAHDLGRLPFRLRRGEHPLRASRRAPHRDPERTPLAHPHRPFDHRRGREKRADRSQERRA